MRTLTTRLLIAASAVLLVAGLAFADKDAEMSAQTAKPWSILDLPEFATTFADVNETEPLNNACPGEPYLLGDVMHAAITAGDQDWFAFYANAGDQLTLATDADGTPTVDTYIQLYAQDCTTSLAFDDDGGPGLYSLINYTATYTGNYYLKVRGYSSASAGLYKFIGTVYTPPVTDCPLDMYKGIKYGVNIPIPDNDPAGITVGPIYFYDDGSVILDVVADLGITHTWVGDLVVTLSHLGTSVQLINRPGVPGSTFGCSGDLVGSQTDKYYFGTNSALEVLGETSCPAQIPTQCYQVAPENPNGLVAFRGMPKGGPWYLTVSDNAGGDTGNLLDFSVHLLNQQPVAVESASWGSVKAAYR